MLLKKKIDKLNKIILKHKSCLIAFSGGLDSSFLLKVASLILPRKNILAVTALSDSYPSSELSQARKLAGRLGVKHLIIRTEELQNKDYSANTLRRCYFCKKDLFSRLKKIALEKKLKAVFDGSSLSDKDDFRPGDAAKKEFGVRSPLREAGFRKSDIRVLSKRLGLGTWDKPSMACLSSRIPYGIVITGALLKRIDDGEDFLRNLGLKQVRLRHHGNICRVETLDNDIALLIKHRVKIVEKLKKLGYNYITLDLEGYRTGSLNEALRRKLE